MTRKLLAAGAIAIGLFALAVTYRHLRPADLESLGGEWYIKPVSVYWAGHSGHWYDLYRKKGAWFVRVETHVSQYRYYSPDCVLFQSSRNEIQARGIGAGVPDVIVAACGSRNPTPILPNGSGATKYEAEGLVTRLPAGISGRDGGWEPASTEVIPIARIQDLANSQPPYRRDWRSQATIDLKNLIDGSTRF